MELERKYVTLSKQKGHAVSQVTLEEDLNVPDQKPDIFRIVHRQGEFCPDEIKGEAGKVKVRGIFHYRILYIGEGAGHMPELLEGSIPVDEVVFLNDLEEGDQVDFRWSQEDLHASAIHSRKANMKTILTLSVEAMKEQPVPLVEIPEAEEDLYVRTCPQKLQQEVIHKKDTIRIREDLNLPPGRPNIHRILWKEVRVQGTEVRPEEGKFIVKGELLVFFLYESEDEEKRLQWIEQGIPFRNEVVCEECRADLTGKTEITLSKAELELQSDFDGEPRNVRVDVVLDLCMRYFEDLTCEVLADAYSLSREILPVIQACAWTSVVQIADSRTRLSGRIRLSENDAPILQVLTSGMQIHEEYAEKTEKGLLLQGNVEVWVLCATEDDAQPMICVQQTFPFEHTVEIQNGEQVADWQIFLCQDQLLVAMLDARELEMKAVLQVQVMFTRTETLQVVEHLEEQPLDMERVRGLPGMVIHVVQPEETLWDIAKNHGCACESVRKLNELKDDNLKAGSKLLLVKEINGKQN